MRSIGSGQPTAARPAAMLQCLCLGHVLLGGGGCLSVTDWAQQGDWSWTIPAQCSFTDGQSLPWDSLAWPRLPELHSSLKLLLLNHSFSPLSFCKSHACTMVKSFLCPFRLTCSTSLRTLGDKYQRGSYTKIILIMINIILTGSLRPLLISSLFNLKIPSNKGPHPYPTHLRREERKSSAAQHCGCHMITAS